MSGTAIADLVRQGIADHQEHGEYLDHQQHSNHSDRLGPDPRADRPQLTILGNPVAERTIGHENTPIHTDNVHWSEQK